MLLSNSQLAYGNNASKADDAKEKHPTKWQSEDVLTPFKELFNSNIAVLMRRMNKNTCPLSVCGHLLNYVGNYILYYAYMSTQKKIFYPKHQALSIQLMGNGDVVTQVLKTEFTMTVDNSVTPPMYNVKEGKQSVVYFRSKSIVIGAGAI